MREAALTAAPGVTVPVVWSFLGYHFPAGSMVVGLLACLMVRLFITLDAPGPKRWVIDGVVTGIALLVTAVWIRSFRLTYSPRSVPAARPGRSAVPPEMTAALRRMDDPPTT